jgi:phosphohistidine phosphatase
MKTLSLLRHAKSSWADPAASDFDRPLNRRGQAAARAMGHEIRTLGLEYDAVLASPALRVVETLRVAAEGYGDFDPVFDRRIYLASCDRLLEIVRGAPDAADRLMLVGHNPGIERLALALACDDSENSRVEIAAKYPTGALAEIALPIDHWGDAAPGTGRLIRFIRPRDLDPGLGPDGS